jgi:hypothetical protein
MPRRCAYEHNASKWVFTDWAPQWHGAAALPMLLCCWNHNGNTPSRDFVDFAWAAAVVAIVAYPVARAMAWIIASFFGD